MAPADADADAAAAEEAATLCFVGVSAPELHRLDEALVLEELVVRRCCVVAVGGRCGARISRMGELEGVG